MKTWLKVALVLANIGAINWGLNALGWNAVDSLVVSWAGSTVGMVVYLLVGVCGLVGLYKVFK
jgi:uncharacterized membrane protein YuzA (DUF378 family)